MYFRIMLEEEGEKAMGVGVLYHNQGLTRIRGSFHRIVGGISAEEIGVFVLYFKGRIKIDRVGLYTVVPPSGKGYGGTFVKPLYGVRLNREVTL